MPKALDATEEIPHASIVGKLAEDLRVTRRLPKPKHENKLHTIAYSAIPCYCLVRCSRQYLLQPWRQAKRKSSGTSGHVTAGVYGKVDPR